MTGRYSYGGQTKSTVKRLTILENKNVKATYFERVDKGTIGRVTPPAWSKIILDGWGEKIDALVSEVSEEGVPTNKSPVTVKGKIVTTTMDARGNWKLSGTPKAYPIAIVFVYELSVSVFNPKKSLGTARVEKYDPVGAADAVRTELKEEVDKLKRVIAALKSKG